MKRPFLKLMTLALALSALAQSASAQTKLAPISSTSYFVDRHSNHFALLKWSLSEGSSILDTALVGRLEHGKIVAAAAFISSSVGEYQIWTRLQKTATGILGVSSTFRPSYRISMQGAAPDRSLVLTAIDPQDGSQSCPSMTMAESSTDWGRDWISYKDLDQDFRQFREEGTHECLNFDYAHGKLEGNGITYSFRELSEASGLLAVRQPQFDENKAGAETLEHHAVDSLGVTLLNRGFFGGKHYSLLRIKIGSSQDSESACLSPASLYEGRK